jgi:hypothetical protein
VHHARNASDVIADGKRKWPQHPDTPSVRVFRTGPRSGVSGFDRDKALKLEAPPVSIASFRFAGSSDNDILVD